MRRDVRIERFLWKLGWLASLGSMGSIYSKRASIVSACTTIPRSLASCRMYSPKRCCATLCRNSDEPYSRRRWFQTVCFSNSEFSSYKPMI